MPLAAGVGVLVALADAGNTGWTTSGDGAEVDMR
jgi:hypothetical protein